MSFFNNDWLLGDLALPGAPQAGLGYADFNGIALSGDRYLAHAALHGHQLQLQVTVPAWTDLAVVALVSPLAADDTEQFDNQIPVKSVVQAGYPDAQGHVYLNQLVTAQVDGSDTLYLALVPRDHAQALEAGTQTVLQQFATDATWTVYSPPDRTHLHGDRFEMLMDLVAEANPNVNRQVLSGQNLMLGTPMASQDAEFNTYVMATASDDSPWLAQSTVMLQYNRIGLGEFLNDQNGIGTVFDVDLSDSAYGLLPRINALAGVRLMAEDLVTDTPFASVEIDPTTGEGQLVLTASPHSPLFMGSVTITIREMAVPKRPLEHVITVTELSGLFLDLPAGR